MTSIFGTLIFIGIIFSAVVPMMMVMNQADTIYEQEINERNTLDDEKSNENIEVFLFAPSDDSEELYLFIQNRGYLPSKIVRVWINDNVFDTNDMLTVSNPNCTNVYSVDKSEVVFNAKVVTEKGNIFFNIGDPVAWDWVDQTWYTPSLAISVIVLNDKGVYKIVVEEWDTGIEIGSYESQGIEFEDITQTFMVKEPIIYRVITQKKIGGVWQDIPGTPKKIPKTIPDWDQSPIKYVFVNGMKLT
jgi:archaellum component FlaF (FlaF/FlaG flagellin family)